MENLKDFDLNVLEFDDDDSSDFSLFSTNTGNIPSSITPNCSGLFQTEGMPSCPSNIVNCEKC